MSRGISTATTQSAAGDWGITPSGCVFLPIIAVTEYFARIPIGQGPKKWVEFQRKTAYNQSPTPVILTGDLGDSGESMAGSVRKRISPSGPPAVSGNITRTKQQRAALTLSPAVSHAWEAREVMDIRQAADYLGISADSLYKYASESLIPAFKLGNRWRFKRSLLDHWMELQSFHGLEVALEKAVKPRQKKPVSRAN